MKVLLFVCALVAAVIASLFLTVPHSNIPNDKPVDVILVLGTPTSIHGHLTQEQAWRVREGVAEYSRGTAPRVLFSGGSASNEFVEADTMATFALQLGLPQGAIVQERDSKTTLENLRNSEQIMREHGWNTVEVISTADHLRRVAALLKGTPLRWRGHSAPTPGRTLSNKALEYSEEAVATSLIRCFGTKSESFIHSAAQFVYDITFHLRRWKLYFKHL